MIAAPEKEEDGLFPPAGPRSAVAMCAPKPAYSCGQPVLATGHDRGVLDAQEGNGQHHHPEHENADVDAPPTPRGVGRFAAIRGASTPEAPKAARITMVAME